MITSSTTIRVRFSETDAVGIVYHARFLEWADAARVEMLDNIGFSYTKLQQLGYHLPIIEAHIQYIKPAFFDNKVRINLTIQDIPLLKFNIAYTFLVQETIIAQGTTIHVFMNKHLKAAKAPHAFKEHILPYFKAS